MTPPADRAAGQSATSTLTPPVGRPSNSRPKTNPACPIPDGEKHNSVRAARNGCQCSGALIARERERDLDRGKSKARRQHDAEKRVAEREAARLATEQEQRERHKPARSAAQRVPTAVREPRADARLPLGMHLRPATNLERLLRERDDLACRGEDPELFHPVGNGAAARAQEMAAKRVCGRCPALDLCGTVSLQMLPVGTVLGGFSDADRRHLRAKGWAA